MKCDLTAFIPVITCVLGALLAHIFTLNRNAETERFLKVRESDIRRRNFRKFVRLCRYRLERIDDRDDKAVWGCYVSLAPDIFSEAALVHGDFTKSDEVARRVGVAAGWRYEDAQADAQSKGFSLRDILRDSIKAIDDATE